MESGNTCSTASSTAANLFVLIFAFHVDVRIIRRRVEQDHGWILVGPMPVEFSDNLEADILSSGLSAGALFQLLEDSSILSPTSALTAA